jgi:hypothetical protein
LEAEAEDAAQEAVLDAEADQADQRGEDGAVAEEAATVSPFTRALRLGDGGDMDDSLAEEEEEDEDAEEDFNIRSGINTSALGSPIESGAAADAAEAAWREKTAALELERAELLQSAKRQASQLAAQEEVIARMKAEHTAAVAAAGLRTPRGQQQQRTTPPRGGVEDEDASPSKETNAAAAANVVDASSSQANAADVAADANDGANANEEEVSTPEPTKPAAAPPMSVTPPERNVRRLQLALCQRDRELRRVQQRLKTLEAAAAAAGDGCDVSEAAEAREEVARTLSTSSED